MTIVENDSPSLCIPRDLSQLEFQRRVLEQAQDERMRFWSGSNLWPSSAPTWTSSSCCASRTCTEGSRPIEAMKEVRARSRELYAAVLQYLHHEIVPKLERSGIRLLDTSELTKHQKERVYSYFKKTILPLLIPLPLSCGYAFPHIINLYLNIAVVLQGRKGNNGSSENIRVTSIVGRYLEHSRIFYFFNNGQEQNHLGSADLMERNLNRHFELLFPLENREHIRTICEEVLDIYLHDNRPAYQLLPDGNYQRRIPDHGERPVNVQNWLMRAR